MCGHKPWSEISTKVRADPKRLARIEQREQAIEASLTISQLREARGVIITKNLPSTQPKTSAPQH